MKLYISGPINGRPNRNIQAFKAAAMMLTSIGYKTLIPHDIPAYHPDPNKPCPEGYSHCEGHFSTCWLRGDLLEMLKCDGLFMLPDWRKSVGACLEHEVAIH